MKYNSSIFWFRQDLRTSDNTGLFHAVENSKNILPLFILDTHIIWNFWWSTDIKFWFIREALEQLSQNIQVLGWEKVIVMHGKPEEIIPKLVETYNIDAIFCNKSYGQYGSSRDEKISQSVQCNFHSYKDFLLVEPHEVERRKVFTPFYKLWQKVDCNTNEFSISRISQLKTQEQSEAKDFIEHKKHPYFTMEFGKKRFQKLPVSWYESYRNSLDVDGTSRLSPYLRFGIYSPRQLYNKVKDKDECYISELAWREFWWHILHHFPETREIEFQEKRRRIDWSQDAKLLEKWQKWETGYPIVDAAMKQLGETNWMHGRTRMIVASFLTKDLHIDWRLWEKYFKQKLLDYDEAVNLGNWQWSASVGADPKPLRIFNPCLQSEKFDPDAVYIKKYLPEVNLENTKSIHNPLDNILSYNTPVVDHKVETKIAREIYKKSSAIE